MSSMQPGSRRGSRGGALGRTQATTAMALVLLLLAASALSAAPPAPGEPGAAGARAKKTDPPWAAALNRAGAAMAARQYADALKALDRILRDYPTKADQALYLKALALHYNGQYGESIKAADAYIARFPDGSWARKALFLKAGSLVKQKNYKAAEAIYESEAFRLLGQQRKHEIAGVIVKLADALAAKPDPNDVGAPPPDYSKAYNLYSRALQMEIGRDLKDDVMFKKAQTIQRGGNRGRARADYQAYLKEFDPDWTGPVGSQARTLNQKKQNPPPAGRHLFEARYHLAESLLGDGNHAAARRELEDLQTLMAKARRPKAKPVPAGDVAWMLLRTYRMPNPAAGELDRAVQVAQDFTARFGRHPRTVEAAWLIAESYRNLGRSDQAVAAFAAFIDAKIYRLPEGELATKRLDDRGKSPAELKDEWTQLAVHQIGQIRFAQKQYAAAIKQWQRYVTKYPNGPHWAASQKAIINAEYQIGLEAVAAKKYDQARKQFDAFLEKHPLDARVPQILFIFGQIHYAEAARLAEEKRSQKPAVVRPPLAAAAGGAAEAYRKAVAEWAKLISRFPRSEQASLAQYRTGLIYEEKLGELEKALEAYRKLTWGSCASRASARVAVMTRKHLALTTERTFRTNEPVKLKLAVRNIEKLTFKLYWLDLASYFRKAHAVGAIDGLDIDLIQPDETFEVKIDGYAKYQPIEQEVELPYEAAKPGVCIINAGEEDLEATTLVIRSDIDLILKSSRREALVFVEDRVAARPAAGVELLFSDGKKILATGETGPDGVHRAKLTPLKDASSLRVFAVRDGHVASNGVGLSGLGFSAGLSPKGYLYTDRPAYRPGEPVFIRGIIRHVTDGSYVAPKGEPYQVSMTDSQGRLLWQDETVLSEFGTFAARMALDANAAVGRYTLTARHKKEGSALVFSGHFQVQRFQTQKMRLTLEPARRVYFRGETVELAISADYYWGQPVADKSIRYVLPNGQSLVEKTDSAGKLTVKFDTTGQTAGTVLTFTASIEGENVAASARVYLAVLGFNIAVRTSENLVLSGEPFDVTVKTTAPDGKPVGAELDLTVLRRQTVRPDPVLAGVPWVNLSTKPAGEVTVLEKKVTTDAKTGEGTIQLTLEAGGLYVLRAAGRDRFKQVVTAQTSVTISDDEDATRLRFFAKTVSLKVGAKADVRLHCRLDAALALLTFEGEEVIDYKVLTLKKGYTPVPLNVGHEHFPNFTVAVAAMDGKHLRTAAKSFAVQRELTVAVKPLKETYVPGAEGKVEITVTDQLGAPARAELSLALVNEALLAIYPDGTPRILDFFQADARRHAEFRVASSCGFSYAGVARPVVKAYLEEGERLARRAEEAKKRADLKMKLAKEPMFAVTPLQPAEPQTATNALLMHANGAVVLNAGTLRNLSGWAGNGRRLGREAPILSDLPLITSEALALTPPPADGGAAPAPAARREIPEAGFWLPAVVTDAKGKAVVTVPMPETTTQWRLTSRGCTVETLLGEATGKVVTRKDFFVEIKCPASATEGDKVAVLARVHNLTDYAGPVELTLKLTDAADSKRRFAQFRRKATVKKNATAEVLFDAVEAPAAVRLNVEVSATGGELSDALVRSMGVRPWGLEFASQCGGTATGDAQATVALPKGREYTRTWMTISVGPSLQRAVIDMALGGGRRPAPIAGPDLVKAGARPILPPAPPRWGSLTGSDLLAVVSAIEYARAAKVDKAADADYRRLTDRARALVGALVVSQQGKGGWRWGARSNSSDWAATAMSFWALARAKQAGIAVHDDTLTKAQTFLKNEFTRASVSNNDAKAVILHALSVVNAADFANVNRLYRERNSLSDPALAYTALTLVNLGRREMAGELLDLLASKAQTTKADGRKLTHWRGATSHQWLNDRVEVTAVALLAMAKVRPTSPRVKEAAAFLLQQRGCYGYSPAKAHGPAVAALAAWFGKGRFAATDYRLTVEVNGKPLKVIECRAEAPTVLLAVPDKIIVAGKNRVSFRLTGRGEFAYAATIRGFSPEIKDPATLRGPRVSRRDYYHDRLEYRGRSIGADSTSPVKNAEIGQRIGVKVGTTGHYTSSRYLVVEEPLPAGTVLVAGSLKGNFSHYQVGAGKITLHYPPGRTCTSFSYQLVGYSTGQYRVLPTVIRDVFDPGQMRVGPAGNITVLAPGQRSQDEYKWNNHERFAMGRAYFNDGLHREALKYLAELYKLQRSYNERELARMLLWIYTSGDHYDARQIVTLFEVLRERHPDLVIPFERILVVGKAYRDIGELERAWYVFRATIDASFINDSNVSAVLQDEGQFLASIDFQEDLWREYPDTPEVVSSYFALSQLLYLKAPEAHVLAKQERRIALARGRTKVPPDRMPNKIDMLAETLRMLDSFMTLYPDNPLADDAAFSMANAFLEMKNYPAVVTLSLAAKGRYADSDFRSGFQYMTALGHFWQRNDAEALKAARVVADGASKDRDFARYILGQIYHAQGKPADAIEWYQKVQKLYPDAKEAIGYFEEKRISLDEVTVFKPGEAAELKLTYRNIKEAAVQVYRVDLMKLYLREKNLANITRINLSGIQPEVDLSLKLGDGKDYVDKETTAKLPIEKEAAYLVICRGDDLFASGVVLITPLKIEVQEDAASGRVRANLIDSAKGGYVPEVHVKAIGSAQSEFKSGQTDLRGLFVADGLRGKATVIARLGEARYAFYRGEKWLGAPEKAPPKPQAQPGQPAQMLNESYLLNLRGRNDLIQQENKKQFDQLRRMKQMGVEVQKAY